MMKPPYRVPQRTMKRPSQYDQFEATELYCPRCRQAMPVRKRLLLVLPEGDKYEYRCAACLTTVGDKIEKNSEGKRVIIT